MDFDSKVTICICIFFVMFFGIFWVIYLSNASYTIKMDDDMRAAIESLNVTMPEIQVDLNQCNNVTIDYLINTTREVAYADGYQRGYYSGLYEAQDE